MPLELNMWGINLYTGGHFDNYIVHYFDYQPGPQADTLFAKPDICHGKPELPAQQSGWRHDLQAQIRSLLPNPYHGAPLPLEVLQYRAPLALRPCPLLDSVQWWHCWQFSGAAALCRRRGV